MNYSAKSSTISLFPCLLLTALIVFPTFVEAALLQKGTVVRSGSGNDRSIQHDVRDTFSFVATGTTLIGWAENSQAQFGFGDISYRGSHVGDLTTGQFLFPMEKRYVTSTSGGLWADVAPDDQYPFGSNDGNTLIAFSPLVPGRSYEFAIEFSVSTQSSSMQATWTLFEANDAFHPSFVPPTLAPPSVGFSIGPETRLSALAVDWERAGLDTPTIVRADPTGVSLHAPDTHAASLPFGSGWTWPESALDESTRVFAGNVDDDSELDRIAYHAPSAKWYVRLAGDAVPDWGGAAGTVGQPGESWFAAVGDMDGDGLDELVNVRASDGYTEFRSSGSFTVESSAFPTATIVDVVRILVGDWNGDGVDEVAYQTPFAAVPYDYVREDGTRVAYGSEHDDIVYVSDSFGGEQILRSSGYGPAPQTSSNTSCIGDCYYSCSGGGTFSCDDLPEPDPCDPLGVPNSCASVSHVDVVRGDFVDDLAGSGGNETGSLLSDGSWRIDFPLLDHLRLPSGVATVASPTVAFAARGNILASGCALVDAPVGSLDLELRGRIDGAIHDWTVVSSADVLMDVECASKTLLYALAPSDSVTARLVSRSDYHEDIVQLGEFAYDADPAVLEFLAAYLPSAQGWDVFTMVGTEEDVFSTDGSSLFLDTTQIEGNGRVVEAFTPLTVRPGQPWIMEFTAQILGERLNSPDVADSVGRFTVQFDDGFHALQFDLGRDQACARYLGSTVPIPTSSTQTYTIASPGDGTVVVSATGFGTIYDGPMGASYGVPVLTFGDLNSIVADGSVRIDGLRFAWVSATNVGSVSTDRARPLSLRVVPNPFNPTTSIEFELSRPMPVFVTLVDVRGREVRQLASGEIHPVGFNRLDWDGRDDRGSAVASGVYFAVLRADGDEVRGKLVLLK